MISKSIWGKTISRTSQSKTGDKKKNKPHRLVFFITINSGFWLQANS
jgi:hypothetical protein